MIKVWNSRSRGGGEGNVDETGNNPSVSLKLEESESNNSYIYHGTLILKISCHCKVMLLSSYYPHQWAQRNIFPQLVSI